MPTTLYDAFAVMKNVSETLKSGNSGKGVPIRFKLLPLALLKSLWNRNRIANTIINRIETGIIKECIELLDKLDDTKRRHNDVRDDYLIYGKYIANRTLNPSLVNDMFIDATNDAKTNLSELLIQIRSGESKSSELQQQFKTIRSNVISPNEILIEKNSKIIQHHIDFINFC